MASVTVNLAPTIPSGTATVYPRSNWPASVDPSGTPLGSSTTSASVGATGATTFSGLTEGQEYVAYQASPDRYVRFRVDHGLGTSTDDPEIVSGTVAVSSVAGTVSVDSTPTTLDEGRKIVTTAGTRVALAASTACKHVLITAETDNTGIVVVGSAAGVIAALATREGTPLAAGKSVSIDIDNLADIGLDSTVSGDGVTFIYTV